MRPEEIKPGIYWVGAVDWNLRNFHGYLTEKGTTYNAYLIVDEKKVLVDTVKAPFVSEMVSRIRAVIDPSEIDYVISNHVEMDHSGSLPEILKLAPGAQVITSPNGEKGLRSHYAQDLPLRVVKMGESLGVGKRTLQFALTPMVHWPDSMVTYVPEEKLLLPNDAFGQHIASSERYDDQIELGVLLEQAAKYYANIVLPYGDQVKKALEAVSQLELEVIGPSHGLIWRTHLSKIVAAYKRWASHETEKRVVIVYDTMWGSTRKIASKLCETLETEGVPVEMKDLATNHMSDIMPHVLHSKGVFIGSPTLNNGMMPSVGGFLTYLKGLRPKNRIGFAFGSYGWGGQAVKEIETVMSGLHWELPVESLNFKWIPGDEELKAVQDAGIKLAKAVGGS